MKNIQNFGLWIALALLLGSCHSVEKLMDQGRYDELLSLAEKRLAGKKKNRAQYVIAAEDAFRRVTARDMAQIERLRASSRSEDWESVVRLAKQIDRRQDRLTPFLPLIADNGYKATFSFVKVDEILAYAESRVIEALYDEARAHLLKGRSGDRGEARIAYDKFNEILSRRGDYREAYAFRDEARELGILYVRVEADNRIYHPLPLEVRVLLERSIMGLQGSFWTNYYEEMPEGRKADLVARLVINGLSFGPESLRKEEIPRKKQIEDGWQYVLDKNGNVLKDSLGNDIKVPRFIEVGAVVVRTLQEKGVNLRADLEIVDARDGQLLERRPVQVESLFTHQTQLFYGDIRALEKGDQVNIAPVPFPSDEAMMIAVAELLAPAVAREARRSRFL